MLRTPLMAATIAMLLSSSAWAQHPEIIVMRKTIEATSEAIPTPWLPDKDRTYTWSSTQDHDVPASCGKVSVPQTVMCKDDLGAQAQDRFCKGTRPPASIEYVDYRSCTYRWAPSTWTDWSSTCSDAATRTRNVKCIRSDGNEVQNGCDATTRPITSETAPQTGSCTYAWKTQGWSGYSSYCSDSATRTRAISCERSDGKTVGQEQCGGTPPATSEQTSVLEGCRFYWKVDSWVDPAPSCGPAVRTAVMSCHRSATDGSGDVVVSEAQCANSGKPSSVEAFDDTRGCTYAWMQDKWSNWSSSCSDTATRSKVPYCSDQSGKTVNDSICAGKPKPATITETSGQYAGCSARWAYLKADPVYPGYCVNGRIPYTSTPQCVDANNKQTTQSLCTNNAALKKPATMTGTGTCSAANIFADSKPYAYPESGEYSTLIRTSYPGKLTTAEALQKAISQCTDVSHHAPSRSYCHTLSAMYYPKVNRTYVEAGIEVDGGDARIEKLPSDMSGAVDLYIGRAYSNLSPGILLYNSDVPFALNGWTQNRVQLSSYYSFYMKYTAR